MSKKIKFIQQILFLLILALLPFNVRYIFNYDSIKNVEGFREHLSLSVYIIDVLLISLIIFQLPILLRSMLRNKHISESQQAGTPGNKISALKTKVKKIISEPFFYFIVSILLSITLSAYAGISFYNGARLLEVIIFFAISSRFLSNYSRIKHWSILTIFLSGVLQSLIAILQFSLQKSIGLKMLGESIIAPTILGVAKFEFSGVKLIRSYGTFPHPNILAAFLILSLACGLWMLLHRKKSESMIGVVGISSGVVIVLIGIFLSYSRSAIVATFFLLFATVLTNKNWFAEKFVIICKKVFIHKFFHGGVALILVFAILFGIYNLLLPRMCLTNCPGDNSVPLRLLYTQKAFSIIHANPLFGIGPGSFVEYLQEHLPKNLNIWEFQPVHNIFLLISSELGLLGLISFMTILITQIDTRRKKQTKFLNNPILLVFFVYLFLGMFDHYFWTLPQGQYLFWLSLAFFSR